MIAVLRTLPALWHSFHKRVYLRNVTKDRSSECTKFFPYSQLLWLFLLFGHHIDDLTSLCVVTRSPTLHPPTKPGFSLCATKSVLEPAPKFHVTSFLKYNLPNSGYRVYRTISRHHHQTITRDGKPPILHRKELISAIASGSRHTRLLEYARTRVSHSVLEQMSPIAVRSGTSAADLKA
ncbi:uncharacterized protein FOMMEDRAFT_157985 [Fomitiporia mediterranea MF3/22]|uniref:uncharacterized protein n=1 Tax=Fomitiporia mediterranea (strain MF3/22) TaxID=694068 RepID=UPI0004408463|nr:uncharacterized protein FOMMEDRAFT_157985 [Fomitiporia mediterranea MF3/22]EJD00874.1 hypothetical protein FOMMEDRAFT_157985 [Fomitiporia mediterranea MF3/22]